MSAETSQRRFERPQVTAFAVVFVIAFIANLVVSFARAFDDASALRPAWALLATCVLVGFLAHFSSRDVLRVSGFGLMIGSVLGMSTTFAIWMISLIRLGPS